MATPPIDSVSSGFPSIVTGTGELLLASYKETIPVDNPSAEPLVADPEKIRG